jgi:glycosyltransferase involved in cell wall biosynthesis
MPIVACPAPSEQLPVSIPTVTIDRMLYRLTVSEAQRGERMKFGIGIPIYNNASNVKNLIFSIRATATDAIPISVFDNGSASPGVTDEVSRFCKMSGVSFSRVEQNKGVPGAWNRLAAQSDADVLILLNDDLRACSRDWLPMIKSVFEQNNNVGIAYWGQKLVSPSTGVTTRYTSDSLHFNSGCEHPLVRANFCGAFFAIRLDLLRDIRQADGSTGFWEDLQAYGEEFDTSAECHKRQMLIVQLPPVWEHLHSQTFSANPRMRVRTDGPSTFLDHAEYVEFCERHPQLGGIVKMGRKRRLAMSLRLARRPPFEYSKLAYSMAMVFKKWNHLQVLGAPACAFFESLMRDGYPRAMMEAAERGVIGRVTLRYQHLDGQLREATWDELVSDPTPSLT